MGGGGGGGAAFSLKVALSVAASFEPGHSATRCVLGARPAYCAKPYAERARPAWIGGKPCVDRAGPAYCAKPYVERARPA